MAKPGATLRRNNHIKKQRMLLMMFKPGRVVEVFESVEEALEYRAGLNAKNRSTIWSVAPAIPPPIEFFE